MKQIARIVDKSPKSVESMLGRAGKWRDRRMTGNKDSLKNAFDTLKESERPTERQKDNMLNYILSEGGQEVTTWGKIRSFITIYPWRFAFGISTVQTVICTLLFGTKYTNLFLSIFGG